MSPNIANVIASIRRVAPYLAIELILPGGSLIALVLWILKNRSRLRHGFARIFSRSGSASQLGAVLRPSTAPTA